MKKIKISELPLYNSLKGLFTIGTDNDNRSVKVSLEFIEDQTEEAVSKADAATKAAIKAKQEADTASQNANDATAAANQAAEQAETARKATETATNNAIRATAAAQNAKKYADEATVKAKEATLSANQATENANKAITAAEKATNAAVNATDKVTKFIERLVPTSLTVKPVPRITIGNENRFRIETLLTPENVAKNLIFISDNKAVAVSPDGQITIVGAGRSTVQVIPTLNTALAQVIQVEVGEPTARLNTRSSLRLTSAGAFRMN